jgi:hypothetical protein
MLGVSAGARFSAMGQARVSRLCWRPWHCVYVPCPACAAAALAAWAAESGRGGGRPVGAAAPRGAHSVCGEPGARRAPVAVWSPAVPPGRRLLGAVARPAYAVPAHPVRWPARVSVRVQCRWHAPWRRLYPKLYMNTGLCAGRGGERETETGACRRRAWEGQKEREREREGKSETEESEELQAYASASAHCTARVQDRA